MSFPLFFWLNGTWFGSVSVKQLETPAPPLCCVGGGRDVTHTALTAKRLHGLLIVSWYLSPGAAWRCADIRKSSACSREKTAARLMARGNCSQHGGRFQEKHKHKSLRQSVLLRRLFMSMRNSQILNNQTRLRRGL